MKYHALLTGFDQGLSPYLRTAFKAVGQKTDAALPTRNLDSDQDLSPLATQSTEKIRRNQPAVCILMPPNTLGATAPLPQQAADSIAEWIMQCIKACAELTVRPRIVVISSAAIYGRVLNVPISEHYASQPENEAASQLARWESITTETMRETQSRGAIARLFDVYGPAIATGTAYQLADMTNSDQHNNGHIQFSRDEERDWIHAADAAAAIARIATTSPIGEQLDDQPHIFNVGTGRSITIKTATRRLLPKAKKIRLMLKKESAQQPAQRQRACIARLRQLDFTPAIPFEKGAETFARWMNAQPPKIADTTTTRLVGATPALQNIEVTAPLPQVHQPQASIPA